MKRFFEGILCLLFACGGMVPDSFAGVFGSSGDEKSAEEQVKKKLQEASGMVAGARDEYRACLDAKNALLNRKDALDSYWKEDERGFVWLLDLAEKGKADVESIRSTFKTMVEELNKMDMGDEERWKDDFSKAKKRFDAQKKRFDQLNDDALSHCFGSGAREYKKAFELWESYQANPDGSARAMNTMRDELESMDPARLHSECTKCRLGIEKTKGALTKWLNRPGGPYKIQFFAEGKLVATQTIQDGNAVEEPERPSKPFHAFQGWFLEDEDSPYEFGTTIENRNLAFVARFEEIPQRIVFYDADSEEFSSFELTRTAREEIEKPEEDPYKWGYRFVGWSLVGDEETVEFPFLGSEDSYAFYPKFEVEPLEIRLHDGRFTTNLTVSINEEIPGIPCPDARYYLYEGWIRAQGETPVALPAPAHEIVEEGKTEQDFWAVRKPIPMEVTFMSLVPDSEFPVSVGTATGSVEKAVRPLDLKGLVSIKGKKFEGDWLLDGKPFDFANTISNAITLVADWHQVRMGSVSFFNRGKLVKRVPEVSFGSKVRPPDNVVDENGNFPRGWSWRTNGFRELVDFSEFTVAQSEYSFYAVWPESPFCSVHQLAYDGNECPECRAERTHPASSGADDSDESIFP